MRIIIEEAANDAKKSSRRSGRGRVLGIGIGVDGMLVGRYGGEAMVFDLSTFRRGVASLLGVASTSREGYVEGYVLSRVNCFCWGVRGDLGRSSESSREERGWSVSVSCTSDLSEVRGGGRVARFKSDGWGGEGGGEKRYLWIGEDMWSGFVRASINLGMSFRLSRFLLRMCSVVVCTESRRRYRYQS